MIIILHLYDLTIHLQNEIKMRILLFFLLIPVLLLGQDPDKVEIIPQKLTDNIYMIKGSGGNLGLMIGPEGTLLIDSQFAPLSEKIKTTIKTLTDSPVKYLLNTHWHGDHTGGNENFAKDGALIIAHDNVYKRKSTDQIRPFGRSTDAAPKLAQPVISFNDHLSMHINGENIMMLHDHVGHTDGDAIVYFPESNVIHMGDTYFQGKYPYIDLGSGGDVESLLKSLNRTLFLCDDETQIIPGHGNLSNRGELKNYRDMIQEVFTRVKQAMGAGLSLVEIQNSNPTKNFDEVYDGGFIKKDKFVEIIFKNLDKGE